MTVEAREIVGDKKIWPQVFDDRREICGELVNVMRKLSIAETRVDNVGDAEGARRAPGLSMTPVCEFRLHNASRVAALSAGEQHKRHQRARRREAVQRSATGDGLIVRMGEYRHDALDEADVPPWDATIRGEKQGASPESSNACETEAGAPQHA
jgi:hypothetical protein